MKLIQFPEPEKNSITRTVDELLESAKSANLENAIVCGFDKDGEFYVQCANRTITEAYFMSAQLKDFIFNQGNR